MERLPAGATSLQTPDDPLQERVYESYEAAKTRDCGPRTRLPRELYPASGSEQNSSVFVECVRETDPIDCLNVRFQHF